MAAGKSFFASDIDFGSYDKIQKVKSLYRVILARAEVEMESEIERGKSEKIKLKKGGEKYLRARRDTELLRALKALKRRYTEARRSPIEDSTRYAYNTISFISVFTNSKITKYNR